MAVLCPADWIFVFGSNEAGRHGKGAALTAVREFGAQKGCGEGFSGRSYALPTKDASLTVRSLDAIRNSVASFQQAAEQRPHLTFMVTRVGCGLAGFDDADIAPMFADAPGNVLLPRRWHPLIGKPLREFRVIINGPDDVCDDDWVFRNLDHILSRIEQPIRIVIGDGEGISASAERYAQYYQHNLARFTSNSTRYETRGSEVCGEAMAWSADGLVIFHDGLSADVQRMEKLGIREGLKIRLIKVR